VHGDYDADGICATALAVLLLRELKADVAWHLPSRFEEGYGLNADTLTRLSDEGFHLVVTVDCGITAVAEVEHARSLGLEVVVTDHHRPADGFPACPVVAPLKGDYPFTGLCGTGVVWKLAQALLGSDHPFLERHLDIVALATVADVVPLVDENRILVRHGLNCLRHYPTPGITALERVTKLDKKRELDCEDIGFTIGPRLNAAGRLGQAQLALELLTTDSTERAESLARYIHDLNDQRKTLERSVYKAANKLAQDAGDPLSMPALVLAGRGWHSGVIGIVAGRLAEHYHRPTILISLDELGAKPGMGSGRSAGGFDLHAGLTACSEHLIGHGGHQAAAGLTIEESSIEPFRRDFCAHAERIISQDERIAEIFVDAETPLTALTHQTVRQIESLAPFGHGNERPMLCTTDVRLAEPPRRIGETGHHLSLRLEQHGVAIRAVAFGGGDWEDDLNKASGPLSVAFKPIINSFRGRVTVEMQLADWRETTHQP
jgi:single-stranded-DNA-specific exonuclease